MKVEHVRDSFSRPADTTAYAAGDLVANSTTAGSVVPLTLRGFGVNDQDSVMIRKVRLQKSGTTTTNASFRVHVFRASPSTITNGDNGAFSVSGTSDYVESYDVTMSQAFTDGASGFGVPSSGFEAMERLVSGSGQKLFALIEARAAYTPASGETFTLSVHAVHD